METEVGSDIDDLDYSELLESANPQVVPNNDEVEESFAAIKQTFPHLNPDQLVKTLFTNLIVPKLSSKGSSRARSIKQDFDDFQQIENFDSASRRYEKKSSHHQYGTHSNSNDSDDSERRYKQDSNVKKGNDIIINGQCQQNLRKAEGWVVKDDKQHKMYASKITPKFTSKDDEVKYFEKRIAAKAFCERGYGLNKVKQEMYDTGGKLSMDKRRYKTVSTAFINQSYRRLQQFLMQDCQRNIRPLTGPQMRAIYSILLNSQSKFDEEDYMTFRKFIKVTFDLGSVSIFQQAAVRLYIKIQTSLRGRVGAMRLDRQIDHSVKSAKREMLKSPGRFQNQRLQSESIWTAQLESDLINTIAQHKTIARTRDVLRQKYGQNIVLNNVRQLKGRFFKILRIAVKRLQGYVKQYAHKVPLLVHLSDDKIKTIIRSPEALESRIALGKLYKTTNFNAQILTETINIINNFCFNDESKRSKNQTLKQPVIVTVADKIKHNVNVTRKMLKNVTTARQRSDATQLVYLKGNQNNYQHIVSLQHDDKLHYFRKIGIPNSKGGFEYEQKPPELKKLELAEGDDDSNELVMLSDED